MPERPGLVVPLQRILYMKRLPALASLPVGELTFAAEYLQERFFPAGSVLLPEGRPVSAIYFVVEGSLTMHRRGALVGRIGRSGAVGGYSLFARNSDSAEVVAETDTLTLELDADAVFELFEDRFQILLHVMKDFGRQLMDLIVRHHVDPTARVPEPTFPMDLTGDLDLVERIFVLRQMLPFQRASINALAELSRSLTQVHFEPGVTLWREGEVSPSVYLMLGGTVLATSSKGVFFRARAGFPLGGLDAVAETPRWYEAVTETRVVALQGNAEALIDVFEDNFDMAMDYLAPVAQGILDIMEARAGKEGEVAEGELTQGELA